MQGDVVSGDEAAGGPFGDGEAFLVEGGEGTLNGVGVGGGLDGEVAD